MWLPCVLGIHHQALLSVLTLVSIHLVAHLALTLVFNQPPPDLPLIKTTHPRPLSHPNKRGGVSSLPSAPRPRVSCDVHSHACAHAHSHTRTRTHASFGFGPPLGPTANRAARKDVRDRTCARRASGDAHHGALKLAGVTGPPTSVTRPHAHVLVHALALSHKHAHARSYAHSHTQHATRTHTHDDLRITIHGLADAGGLLDYANLASSSSCSGWVSPFLPSAPPWPCRAKFSNTNNRA